jgi:hypothetical protein
VCHVEVFKQMKGMQMVQNKKVGVGLALIAALIGMGACGTALALPEMEVGSHLVQNGSVTGAQALPTAPADTAIADDTDVADDDDAQSTSN